MSNPISRRDFLLQSAFTGGSLWVAVNSPRPRALRAAQESAMPAVFSESEWKTVEAISGRIIPSDADPGAIEANCVNFIDKALANEDAVMRPAYAEGLVALDAVSKERFEKAFVELEAGQQDELLAALESGSVDGWPSARVRPERFFAAVRMHTVLGFLSDPKYGGNREYAGWQVVGYPGPRHHGGGYTPDQMAGKEAIVPIWEIPKQRHIEVSGLDPRASPTTASASARGPRRSGRRAAE